MSVLLTIDLLGATTRWRSGDPGDAAALFDDFADLVLDTVGSMDVADQIHGDIEANWCSLLCPTIEAALALSRRIFRRAWLDPRSADDMRLWMRASVSPSDDDAIRHTGPDEELAQIRRTTATPSLMRSLAALRGGLQGMRILVDESLLSDPLRGMFRVPLGRLGFIPFRRMNFTPYPATLKRTWQDFLWMADTQTEWVNYTLRMKQRLLWTANDPGEALEAAATQVVFHEVDAIVQSVVRKNTMRGDDGRSSPRREQTQEHESEAEGN